MRGSIPEYMNLDKRNQIKDQAQNNLKKIRPRN